MRDYLKTGVKLLKHIAGTPQYLFTPTLTLPLKREETIEIVSRVY